MSGTADHSTTQPAPTPACLLCPDNNEDDGIFNPSCHLEIMDLHISGNGRSCDFHDCCGRHIKVGDLLCIKKTLVNQTDGVTEEALCCLLINERNEACRVAFIPRNLCNTDLVLKNLDRFLQVVELLRSQQPLSGSRKAATAVERQE